MYSLSIHRTSLVLAVSLGLILAGPATAPAQKLLRWKFKAGEKLSINATQDLNIEMSVSGKSLKVSTDTLTEMTWVVDAVDEEGVATITQAIDRIKIDLESPGMGGVKYDSASGEEPAGAASQVAQGVGPLIGARIAQKMSTLGEVLEVTIPDEVTQKLAKAPGGSRLEQIFSKESLSQLTGQAGVCLPKRPVRKGDRWKRSVEVRLPQGKVKGDVTYTHQGTATRDSRELDVIAVELKVAFGDDGVMEVETDDAAVSATVKVKDQNNTGKMYFDAEAGRFVETSVRHRMVLETISGEKVILQDIRSEAKMTILSRM